MQILPAVNENGFKDSVKIFLENSFYQSQQAWTWVQVITFSEINGQEQSFESSG